MTQDMPIPIEHGGRCLCGAVRFTATGSTKWISYRHCESCHRHTGHGNAGERIAWVHISAPPLTT